MTVKVMALVTLNEDKPRALAKYLELTEPVLERAGARIVERFTVEGIIGQEPARTVIIVEYPDRAAVDAVFQSPEYAEAKQYRDIAFSSYSVNMLC